MLHQVIPRGFCFPTGNFVAYALLNAPHHIGLPRVQKGV
jgi:hypothetical protein